MQLPRHTFNFSQILDTKNTIEQHYVTLLNKHEEQFKTIVKTTTDISLVMISASIEDFQDVIKALPQMTKIETPGPNVIKLFTTVFYCHSMVIPSFCVIKLCYLGNY